MYTEADLQHVRMFSIEQWDDHISNSTTSSDKKIIDKILKYLNYSSFGEFIKLNIEDALKIKQNPTQVENSEFAKRLLYYQEKVRKSYKPIEFYRFFYMLFQGKKFENIIIQSYSAIRFDKHVEPEFCQNLVSDFKKFNAYLKHKKKNGNHDYSIEQMEKISSEFSHEEIEEKKSEKNPEKIPINISNKTENIISNTFISKSINITWNSSCIKNTNNTVNTTNIVNINNNLDDSVNPKFEKENHAPATSITLKNEDHILRIGKLSKALESNHLISSAPIFSDIFRSKKSNELSKVKWNESITALVYLFILLESKGVIYKHHITRITYLISDKKGNVIKYDTIKRLVNLKSSVKESSTDNINNQDNTFNMIYNIVNHIFVDEKS